MKKLSFILFSVILLCAGCRKDKLVVTETIIHGEDPEVLINTSITGVVVDESDAPLNGARINVGSQQTFTDDNGFFYLKDIKANQNGATVRAEQSGFFSTSQLVFPKLNSVEFVKIKMIASTESGLVSAGSGGSVDIGDGAKVEFPANAFTLNGAAYTGSVSVHTTFIDPLADDLFERMPGSLLGVNSEGRIMGMETFGMIGVDLYTSSGEVVEMAKDKKATLTFPVPAEILGEAPSEIVMWHYDVDLGYWMEEGTAILTGSNYIAEVAHFSFWNCDDPFETVLLGGRVINSAGMGVAGAKVHLRRQAPTNNTGYAITDIDGRFNGKIPAGEILELELYDPCGTLVHSQNIGPFSNDEDLADLTVSLPNEANISGRIVDCTDQGVDYGYLQVSTLGESVLGYITTDADGNFNGLISVCDDNDLKVIGVDLKNSLQSNEQTVVFNNTIDLGTIQACDNVIPTFIIRLDGDETILGNAWAGTYIDTTMTTPATHTQIGAEDSGGYVSLDVEGEGIGTFDVSWISIRLNNGASQGLSDPRIEVTFTRYDAPGPDAFISGNYEGVAYDPVLQKDINVEGSFNAKFE